MGCHGRDPWNRPGATGVPDQNRLRATEMGAAHEASTRSPTADGMARVVDAKYRAMSDERVLPVEPSPAKERWAGVRLIPDALAPCRHDRVAWRVKTVSGMRSVVVGFRTTFVAGLVVVVPAVATFLTLRFLFRNVDGLLAPLVAAVLGVDVVGLGVLSTLGVVLLAGLVVKSYLGRRLVAVGDRAVTRIPVVRAIYKASRDIVETATLSRRQIFREVVLLEYPRREIYSYGFVTAYTSRVEPGGRELANVFIPGPPIPTTGALVAVPVEQLIYLDISVEEALKLVLSGGMVAPPSLRARPRGGQSPSALASEAEPTV